MTINGGFNRARRYNRRQMSHFVASLPLGPEESDMKDIYDAIEKWLSEPDNNSPEKRAKFLIRANRMVYVVAH